MAAERPGFRFAASLVATMLVVTTAQARDPSPPASATPREESHRAEQAGPFALARDPAAPAFDVPLPEHDLWHRIRVGFLLEPLESRHVAQWEAWYASRPDYLARLVERGSLYLHHIVEEVEKRGMPTEVALIPVIESAFNPHAYSRARASGLWQFIPSTGKLYGLSQDVWNDERRDVIAATEAALNYLQRLYDEFNSWELAFAAYNCGEGCVGRAIAANQRRGLPTDYLSLKLPNETVHYVPKLIAVKNLILAPSFYGVELGSIPDRPYFTTVPAPPRIDVSLAAKFAGMPVEEFIALNPSHNKAIAVAREGTLVLPLDRAGAFRENLGNWNEALVTWQPVQGKKGEAVADLARRYGISVAELRQANNLKLDRGGRLAHAQPVLVPGKSIAAAKAAPPESPAARAAGGQRSTPADAGAPFYTVKAGDSLWSISKEVGREIAELLSLNNLTEKSVLRPGMRLKVN